MRYAIRIKESAARELQRIERPDRERLIAAIDRLSENPFAGSALKGEAAGAAAHPGRRLPAALRGAGARLVVLVLRAAHRREAYRRRTR